MYAIEVKDIGILFKLYHQTNTTLHEAFVNLFRQKIGNNNSHNSGYEKFWAVRNLSFEVKRGETLGIIGRNGSGKSTLLKILAGIYRPDEGEVKINGKVIGLLELGAGFHEDLSGRDNIYMNGAILGFKKREIDEMYDRIVDFSELGKFIDTPIRNYSSGMKVRLGFSIAVNVKPEILLIDEVLAVGDESFQKKSKQKLDELRSGDKTIVFVSHSMGEVKRICDRVIYIDSGGLVFNGAPDEAIEQYMKKMNA